MGKSLQREYITNSGEQRRDLRVHPGQLELTMKRLALTISEACEFARASRTSLYGAIGRGELAARKRGRRTIVLVDDLRNWIENLPKLSVETPRAPLATSTTSRSTN
jgi:hypothetical protein